MNIVCNKFSYKERLNEQRSLFVECFPENIGTRITSEEHYFWKFRSFPNEIKSYEYIADIENEMAGYYAAIPYQYNIAGKRCTVGMVCDVMTSANFRGKGIFTKLGAYSLNSLQREKISFTMGYPIRKEVLPGHLKVGWRIAFRLPLYMRFLRSDSLLREKGYSYLSGFINPIFFLYNWLVKKRMHQGVRIVVYRHVEDITGYNEFIKQWSDSILNSLDKSLDFVRWRYSAPGKDYYFISAYKGEKLVGFSSVREIVKENIPSLGIVDFMILLEHRECLNDIHNKIFEIAHNNKREIIMTMMSRTSASTYKMLRNGFFKSPFYFQLIINKLNIPINDEALFDERKWHLMFVDSDDL